MDEQMLGQAEGIYCWRGKKMKATLFSAKIGRLVLTDRRLVFLSTGKSDAGRLALGAALPFGNTLGGARTDALDFAALENQGSLDIPIQAITRCEPVKRALSVSYRDADGHEHDFAFSEKMAMPGRDEWVARINSLRTSAA